MPGPLEPAPFAHLGCPARCRGDADHRYLIRSWWRLGFGVRHPDRLGPRAVSRNARASSSADRPGVFIETAGGDLGRDGRLAAPRLAGDRWARPSRRLDLIGARLRPRHRNDPPGRIALTTAARRRRNRRARTRPGLRRRLRHDGGRGRASGSGASRSASRPSAADPVGPLGRDRRPFRIRPRRLRRSATARVSAGDAGRAQLHHARAAAGAGPLRLGGGAGKLPLRPRRRARRWDRHRRHPVRQPLLGPGIDSGSAAGRSLPRFGRESARQGPPARGPARRTHYRSDIAVRSPPDPLEAGGVDSPLRCKTPPPERWVAPPT